MAKTLDTPVRYLKGIGPKRAKIFNQLGLNTIEDILYFFPRRYEDRTNFLTIAGLIEGQFQTIKAQVLAKSQRQSYKRRGFSIIEVTVGDATGKMPCVWFNQPYLKDYFKVGQSLILYGRIERYAGKLQMSSPEFEIISEGVDESLNIGRIVPVYPLSERLTQRAFRQLVKSILDEYSSAIGEFIPYDIRAKNNLLNLAQGLINIHFPQGLDLQKEAYRRLSFDEFFLFQLPLVLRKIKKKEKQGIAHRVKGKSIDNFIAGLPFKLTVAQERVLLEIKEDLAKPVPMQRLLQGDVGSGKTIVATIAGLMVIQGGYQVAFMVPTEILAKQHFDKISGQSSGARSGLLTSGLGKREKEKTLQKIKEGEVDLVIGTHALLEEGVRFKNLGLVVIDEQHKFGVGQRALLPEKGVNPDVLIMTATPIPRTLAITLYGDLDISVINELPAGRLPVKTLRFSREEKEKVYDIAREQLRLGHQAYIIYPVIEESYALDMAGAKKMYLELKSGEFKEFKLGLIHGRLKEDEQDEIMLKFKNKELDILVSTTVLEVGIDIANATCMIIENAERFGLSQLHQLRGRVGRGRAESFCILISGLRAAEVNARLDAMVRYGDGFRIAEEDLKIRGPGEFFGKRQHGLSELKIGNPLTQMQLLKLAREEALNLLGQDPGLKMRPNVLLRERLLARFPEYEKLMVVG